jgi:hypothetical protein
MEYPHLQGVTFSEMSHGYKIINWLITVCYAVGYYPVSFLKLKFKKLIFCFFIFKIII